MLQRPMAHVKTMEAANIMEDVDTTATNPVIMVEEDAAHKTTVIVVEAMVVDPTVILHITVVHTECVPIWSKTAGPHQTDTKMTRCGVTRYQEVKETSPDSSGQYLLVKIIYKELNHIIHLNYYVALL